jgi:hypothetical protein
VDSRALSLTLALLGPGVHEANYVRFGVCFGTKLALFMLTVERVAECETVEVANIHAGFLDVAEIKAAVAICCYCDSPN